MRIESDWGTKAALNIYQGALQVAKPRKCKGSFFNNLLSQLFYLHFYIMEKNISQPKNNSLISLFKPDLSVLILLISNLVVVFFAISKNSSLFEMMFVYWIQSIIIGIFTLTKIILIKKNNLIKTYYHALFFIGHYGAFNLIYLFFFITNAFSSEIMKLSAINIEYKFIFLTSIIFFINHLFSFIYNFKEDSKKETNPKDIMISPYLRTIPLHIIVVLGFFLMNSKIALIVFLILKIFVDLIMHQNEHKKFIKAKFVNRFSFTIEFHNPLKNKHL
jgi:hypothetical protein